MAKFIDKFVKCKGCTKLFTVTFKIADTSKKCSCPYCGMAGTFSPPRRQKSS